MMQLHRKRCPNCGEPTLDGHVTCGKLECNEHKTRREYDALAPILADARLIVDLLRAHGRDFTLMIDHDDAVDVVTKLVRAAYSQGILDGTREEGERALAGFDRAIAVMRAPT